MNPWAQKRVLLLGGPGGVGKTTLAASLGLAFARRGLRTVVLTVDPARRLAQALGFEGFGSELQKVEIPNAPGANLFATMLDSQRYLDKVMARFAKDDRQRDRILNNPLYRTTTETMGGTQEYAAMERLLEFYQDPQWERIVVDTPPTSNAVDLISAPQRLAQFMDSSVMKWFQGSQPGYLGFFRKGTRLAMKFMEKIFGAEFMGAFGAFMDDLDGMQAGFRNRHLEVLNLLRGPQSSFLLVSYPSEARHDECIAFQRALRENNVPLGGLVLNRVQPAFPPTWEGPLDEESRHRIQEILHYYAQLREGQQEWLRRFDQSLGEIPRQQVPRHGAPLHDLTGLCSLGESLLK